MPEVLPEVQPTQPSDLMRDLQHHADRSAYHARKAAAIAQLISRLNAEAVVAATCSNCQRFHAEVDGLCFGCSAYKDSLTVTP